MSDSSSSFSTPVSFTTTIPMTSNSSSIPITFGNYNGFFNLEPKTVTIEDKVIELIDQRLKRVIRRIDNISEFIQIDEDVDYEKESGLEKQIDIRIQNAIHTYLKPKYVSRPSSCCKCVKGDCLNEKCPIFIKLKTGH